MSDLDDQMIELTIEALTGTVYDLCVSPFETILGIKMKIQRLEGIPVYQQQLVHGNTELHDEFCLEEYSIGSGAQLKLLLAMRGGPIHAHRVQLEDPTLFEIAEVLEDQDFDHKYTVMLLRDGDTLDMADFVQVVADESPGHVSPLSQTTSSEQETTSSSLALSKVTRNKMQDLMCRLRSRKQMSQSDGVSIEPSGSHLHRRGAKVLILDSRSSSRLLHSTAPSPVTPHPRATPTQNPSTVHRKLVFPAEEKDTHTNNSGKCEGSSVEEGVHPRHHKAAGLDSEHQLPPQQQTSHRQQSRVCPQQSSEPYQTTLRDKQSDRQQRHWRMKRRLRRPSCLQDNNTVPHHKDVSELAKELSLLGVREGRHRHSDRINHKATADPLPHLTSLGTDKHTTTHPHHHTFSSGVPHLPAISVGHAPCLTGRGRGKGRPHCAHCGKKTGLTTTYPCRCGGVFCSLHRYAESHDCSFDYKTQGRELIARGNPLIVAPKLPKI